MPQNRHRRRSSKIGGPIRRGSVGHGAEAATEVPPRELLQAAQAERQLPPDPTFTLTRDTLQPVAGVRLLQLVAQITTLADPAEQRAAPVRCIQQRRAEGLLQKLSQSAAEEEEFSSSTLRAQERLNQVKTRVAQLQRRLGSAAGESGRP